MKTYVGSMITDKMKASLRGDLLIVVDRYLADTNLDCDVRVEQDREDLSRVYVTLVLDCSVIRSISDLSRLPEYLAHELEGVRELASERLEELKHMRL